MNNIFFKVKNRAKINKQLKILKSLNENYKNYSDKDLKRLFFESINDEVILISILSEISFRILGLRPYREQLMGVLSIAINGYLVEMKTGEGKTLTAGLAALIRAARGHKTFVLTVNEYLSQRDLNYNKKLFDYFDISNSALNSNDNFEDRRKKYESDIIYGTASDFVFDYLRDNTVALKDMLIYPDRKFDSVIIDEIDSILIDESSTPLIISSKNKNQNNELILKINNIVKEIYKEKDIVIVDSKDKTAILTEKGIDKVESLLGIENLYDHSNIEYLHRVEEALLAFCIYKKEKDYIVNNEKIILIDQSTGRLSHGRQMSYGLHQALEAKEGVNITYENMAIAKITYQSFFNKFNHLTGMTGTAKTEEEEFLEIYNLEIIVIPTHKKMIREDLPDKIFINHAGKLNQLIHEVRSAHEKGQPILIGTTSVEENEYLSEVLKKEMFKFNQLDAKNVVEEAKIIESAGEFKSITLATNMAGRGIDIKITEESRSVGGLFVIGYGKNDNRRIDNQLKGRSGRQGDPGKSLFLVSLEDSLVVDFSENRLFKIIKNLNVSQNEIIESNLVSKVIEKAQKTKENVYFEARKNLVKFDSVLSIQRDKIYGIRRDIINIKDKEDFFSKLRDSIFYLSEELTYNEFDILKNELKEILNISIKKDSYPVNSKEFVDFMEYTIFNKFNEIDNEICIEILRGIYIKNIDTKWIRHLNSLEAYQDGVDNVKLAQKDPLIEYQKKAFAMFEELLKNIKESILYEVFNIKFEVEKVDMNKVIVS